MSNDNKVIVDTARLRTILSERGLPTKVGAKLNKLEQQVHAIVCAGFDFKVGFADLEIPEHVLRGLGKEFKKVWMLQQKPVKASPGKVFVLFGLREDGIKMVIRTALNKDRGIFEGKLHTCVLTESWARYLRKGNSSAANKQIDWSEAEQAAKRFNQHTVKNINDGKTFNAQKDNPWARKNLKNKNKE